MSITIEKLQTELAASKAALLKSIVLTDEHRRAAEAATVKAGEEQAAKEEARGEARKYLDQIIDHGCRGTVPFLDQEEPMPTLPWDPPEEK